MPSEQYLKLEKNILDTINSPKDVKNLNPTQLKSLATEIRNKILETVSKNGGHLGSPLGAVELAIALHYVFDSPKDKIIWDTSHQSYPHKLLTGRRKNFHTLRQYKGISGFCNIKESEHDVFGTGHASTSISAALGIAKARDLKKENYKVIAVIGDGAMTAGLAFEGLNNAGSLKTDLIVILNDNKMSISPNVGAISKYFNKIVVYPKYFDLRKKTEALLKKLPGIGIKGAKKALEIEERLRTFVSQGILFEELGFNYFGPIDGHNINELISALKNIKSLKEPVLLHIKTEKGKGYKFAESDADKFHGMSPFDITNGQKYKKSSYITYTEAFGNALVKIAEKNEKIVAITAAMKSGTGLNKFEKNFPDRFFDVGIAEQHAVTFAAGLAINGLKPVCAIYSTFLQRAYDQIVHDVCLQNLPVIFAIDRAGLVGDDGPTHNGPFDIVYLRSTPNTVVMIPKDENELQHMLYTATFVNAPASVRYPRGNCIGTKIDENLKKLEIGKGEILKNGNDAAIIGIGPLLYDALEAANKVKYNIAVINARFAKPLDEKLIMDIAKKTGNIITLEEGALNGGFGSAVFELLKEKGIDVNIKRMGIPDKFIEHGNQEIQKELCCLTEKDIIDTIESMLK